MSAPARTRRYIPAVGPKLRKLLNLVFALFALLAFNAVYLGGISFAEWLSGETHQDYFYQIMFLIHLGLGLLLILPLLFYGLIHIRNAHNRPNRRAVKVGHALYAIALLLLISGLVLTRGLPLVEIRQPEARELAYWLHVVSPLIAAWLFVLHRLAGPRIRWRMGGWVAAGAAVVSLAMLSLQSQDPRQWNQAGPADGMQYFLPSLAQTTSGNFIPAETLMMDDYCQECHQDVHDSWSVSAHRFASFNNPAYLFSVRKVKEFSLARDGNDHAARFCAGCHDLAPFFSGALEDPDFDDQNHPTATAGITCSGCHAITHLNSTRGNADYRIEEPQHYPFTFSDSPFLQWINRTLVKAKPEFHKKAFLKPLHKTPEFCGSCHKVHLPQGLNGYKWLRGQNHYDAYHLSGISGHGIKSFYYPPKARHACAECHMPLEESEDFGAQDFDNQGLLKVHNHQFQAANTALPHLLGLPDEVNDAHRRMLEGALRVDIIALREDGQIDGELIGPLRPSLPTLQPGKTYLLEVVLRTLTVGHLFTQGTADSNEVWVDVTVSSGNQVIGRSGGMDPKDGNVDPWSHFVNAYAIDREGNRIDRRNGENLFTMLYNHQIPPGAADSLHFVFTVPDDAKHAIELSAKLNYRKFDTTYMRYFQGKDFRYNDLPITTIAGDRVTLPVTGSRDVIKPQVTAVPEWQRWNDYGIGLLRKGKPGQLRQAEEAFGKVEALGRAYGPLNLARVYLKEGRLNDAVAALERAGNHESPAYPWSLAYFTAQVNRQNGYLDKALQAYEDLLETRFPEARKREFDFGQDYSLRNEYAETLLDRSKLERRNPQARQAFLHQAEQAYLQVLALDSENARAHFGLSQVYRQLGSDENMVRHRELHKRYKPDDNAWDQAIALARSKSEAADHAADAVVIYDLQRPGAYELLSPPKEQQVAVYE